MVVGFHRTFRKQLKKLPDSLREAFEHRLQRFMVNQHTRELNNHGLSGKWEGYRSINISGDVRAIYLPVDKEAVFFVEIGTHHELYGS